MRLHIVDIFWLQAYFLLVKSDFATIGSFFQQKKNGDEVNLKMGEAFIKPEFFHCDQATSCSRVLESQGTGHYLKNTEVTTLEEEESVIAAWKKAKQPTGECFVLLSFGQSFKPSNNGRINYLFLVYLMIQTFCITVENSGYK